MLTEEVQLAAHAIIAYYHADAEIRQCAERMRQAVASGHARVEHELAAIEGALDRQALDEARAALERAKGLLARQRVTHNLSLAWSEAARLKGG